MLYCIICGLVLISFTHTSIRFTIIKTRRSRDRLIFMMGILYMERRSLYRNGSLGNVSKWNTHTKILLFISKTRTWVYFTDFVVSTHFLQNHVAGTEHPFPVYRWFRHESPILIQEHDASLPQDSVDKPMRKKELEFMKPKFELTIKLEGLLPQVSSFRERKLGGAGVMSNWQWVVTVWSDGLVPSRQAITWSNDDPGIIMMTSSSESIFCVTGPLWGESNCHGWIPLTNANKAELWCFLWCALEKRTEQKVEMLVIWVATCGAHSGVNVMNA